MQIATRKLSCIAWTGSGNLQFAFCTFQFAIIRLPTTLTLADEPD
jgi:hypothetical protein